MTRYSTDHIPGDDGRNVIAKGMNTVVGLAEEHGDRHERASVAILLSVIADKYEIEEAKPALAPVCRNPENEDRI